MLFFTDASHAKMKSLSYYYNSTNTPITIFFFANYIVFFVINRFTEKNSPTFGNNFALFYLFWKFLKNIDKLFFECYNKSMKRAKWKNIYNNLIINKGNVTLYNTTADQLNLTVTRCGFQGNSIHAFKDVNSFHVLQYCTKGKGTLILQGNEYLIEEGTLFYLPMNVRVHYFCDETDPYSYYWICFNGDSAQKLLKMAGLSVNSPCVHMHSDKLEHLFQHVFDTLTVKKTYCDCALLADLYEVFDILISHNHMGVNAQKRAPSEVVNKAITYMEQNFHLGISINDVCQQLSMHPSSFSSLFTKEMGCSPVKFLMGIRVEHASLLLRTTNLSISEIALQVGISPLTLTSIFKKRTKKTPSQYRNENKVIDIN